MPAFLGDNADGVGLTGCDPVQEPNNQVIEGIVLLPLAKNVPVEARVGGKVTSLLGQDTAVQRIGKVCASVPDLPLIQAGAWTWLLARSLVHIHGFNSALVSVAALALEGWPQPERLKMKAWKLPGNQKLDTGPLWALTP